MIQIFYILTAKVKLDIMPQFIQRLGEVRALARGLHVTTAGRAGKSTYSGTKRICQTLAKLFIHFSVAYFSPLISQHIASIVF